MTDPHIREAMNEWDRRYEAGEAEAEIIQARVDGLWQDKEAIVNMMVESMCDLSYINTISEDEYKAIEDYINKYFTKMARDELNL